MAETILPVNGAVAPTPPLPLAAVDVGSNAIRLMAAEFSGPAHYRVLAQERLPVRLGREVFRSGHLAEEVVERALEGLAGFRRQMDSLGVQEYRAVATSAVREAEDADRFVERVRQEAGLALDVITGSEEARLVHLAVRDRVRLGGGRWLLVDVGGGSVEVALLDRTGLLGSESHTIGTVRLLEELRLPGTDPLRAERLVSEYVSTISIASALRRSRAAGLIATGGNAEALASLAGAEPDEAGVRRLSLAELRRVLEHIAALSPSERVKELGLREDRADVILPAAHIYERLATVVRARKIVVPDTGLKEGVLLDLADRLVRRRAHEDEQERATLAGAVALGRRYRFDEAHGVHVGRLAVSLFDQLAQLHGLGAGDRRLLLAGAVVHDIGLFISHKRHHKHSLYIVQNAEISGFDAREMLMIGNIARYHRKGGPSKGHEQFERLDEDDRERVRRLSALLRIADALDREHVQRVRGVRAEVDEVAVRLEPDAEGELMLEQWALERKSDVFAEIFGLSVVLA